MPISVDELKTSVPEAASGGGVSIGPVATSVPEASSGGGMSIGPVATSVAAPGAKPKVDPAAIKAAFGHLAD